MQLDRKGTDREAPPCLGPVPPGVPGQPTPTVFKPQLDAHFDGMSGNMSYFLVAMNQFLWRLGHQFVDDEECIKYISGCFDGREAQWYVDLYELGALELRSLPLFVRAL